MLFVLLFYFSLSANVYPVIPESYIKGYFSQDDDIIKQCLDRENNYSYNTYTFKCEPIDPNQYFHPNFVYNVTEEGFNVTNNCSGLKRVFNTCIPNISLDTSYTTICNQYSGSLTDECLDILSLYRLTYEKQVHPQALQFLINQLVLSSYNQKSNQPFNNFYLTSDQGHEGYLYWPLRYPFFSYLAIQVSLNNVLEENYITSRFRFSRATQFYLARYRWNGEFIGFTPLTTELNKCGNKNDISQIWRKFGTSIDFECFFDLISDSNEFTNEFLELFIGDGRTDEGIIMRPIPVLFNGELCRRFYKFNNLTSTARYISSTNINFQQISSDDAMATIRTPYFTFSTREVDRELLSQLDTDIRFKSESNQHPKYKFKVDYTMDLGNFRQMYTYIAIVLGVFFFIILMFRIVITILFEGRNGINNSCCCNIISLIFQVIGVFFFLMAFGLSVIFLIFYKWQKAIFWFFPPNNFQLFEITQPFIYVALIAVAICVFVKVYFIQLSNNFVIMDWETPVTDNARVSAWRRINLSNELCRIITIRSYSVTFTAITSVFILNGFQVENLASPIPTSRLIDIGYDHWILRFGMTTSLWIILMALQYFFFHYIYWRFWGNPYFNFLDLCTVSNLSLFISTSSIHGYYLHGKSIHGHSDVDMKKLSQALVEDEEGFRGLDPQTTDQVFEVFFSRDFSLQLFEKQENIRIQFHHVKLKMTADEISQESIEMYDSLNNFLKMFIDGPSENKYTILPRDLLQILFKAPLQIANDSVMNKVKDTIYKRSLLAGAEWMLMLLYLLLFCTIDAFASSPGIAAFVVYVLDWIIVTIYDRLFRLKLAKTSLLDSRFLLT